MTKGALVIGGGITGIQAALDLAYSAIKVYLVERTPSIGGRMAQLDKTFPTNDCSMCILAPKMVDAGRHPNIELLTYSEVKEVSGEVGNFKVKELKRPRYIDESKCTGCGLCAEACSLKDIFPNDFDLGLKKRGAVYVPFPQAVPLVYTIDKREEEPPCRPACPANTNVQGYVALIASGKFKEALDLIRERIPLPAICGRVCPHPCEDECNRGEFDEPISIAALKRFVADYELKNKEKPSPIEKTRDEKVAIIGSGPAGLTAAHDLAKMGYSVTIFEKLPVAGGMLHVGIPEYRLPRDVLQTEIDYIRDLGVEIKTDTPIENLEDLKDYDAIFIGVGAHKSLKLNVPGEDLEGVIHGVSFLRDLNLGKDVKLGDKVVIVGGGNVAIDAARSALRLGKKVTIVYRRSREEMPASEWEIEDAEEEGVEITYLTAPKKIIDKNGKVAGMECIKMELGEPDESGRRRPIPIEGSEFVIEADTIIPAIGQSPDISFLKDKFETTKWGTIQTNNICATSESKIFAGGDATRGPATVVEAIADGKKAALSIDAYLRGESLEEEESLDTVKIEDMDLRGKEKTERRRMQKLPVEERIHNFNEVELGFTEEMAVEEAKRCLNCGICSECRECEKVCEAGAVDFNQKGEAIELGVGSIIVTTGFDQFDPSSIKEYGYGIYPNVITGLEFERLLNASGPTGGHLLRPSDDELARNIVFVQCVGSRDVNACEYCSRACCMYALKEGVIAREHEPDLGDVSILYMDIRAYGKDFERYRNRAEKEHNINLVRGRVAEIIEDEDTKDLIIRVENTSNGESNEIRANMVVLSSAMVPSKDTDKLGEVLGIELGTDGFFKETYASTSPMNTSRKGIYIAGCAAGPKDIPDSVAQASGAAALASIPLVNFRVEEEEIKVPRIDISGKPRIGVFVCHCGINIGGVVDVPSVAEYAESLPNVVHAEHNLYTCSDDTQALIQKAIKEQGLNRVVVAACTPRTHEPLFQKTMKNVGLNPYLFEFANIRDQCSWVHMKEPARATEKAKDLVRMAVSKVALLEPLEPKEVDVIPVAMVIGAGISGMQAALDLDAQGFDVYLIEKESELGGMLNHVGLLSPQNIQASELIKEKIGQIGRSNIKVMTGTEVTSVEGFIGNFNARLSNNEEIKVGTIIMAIGADMYDPTGEYGYDGKNVITNLELEQKLAKNELNGTKSVTFIQCVGSRNSEREDCSRYCCQIAVKQAIELRELGADVTILHRGISTFSKGAEEMYKQACENGVQFIRFPDGQKPVVSENGKRVIAHDEPGDIDISLSSDLIVLSTAMIPREAETAALQQMLKIPRSANGFFMEQHPKLAPVETNTDGIYLCGTCQFPKNVADSVAQASGAAAKAAIPMAIGKAKAVPITSLVDEELCIGCRTCESLCPYRAIRIEDGKTVAEVVEVLCKGCGVCAASCPEGAVKIRNFTDRQLIVQGISALREVVV